MTDRIERMLLASRRGDHHSFRFEAEFKPVESLQDLSDAERVTERLCEVLKAEKPVILPDETIVFTRTVKKLPAIFTEAEWKDITDRHFIHEQGRVCNISPDYERVIGNGLDKEREKAVSGLKTADEKEKVFLNCVIRSIDAVLELSERYRKACEEAGNVIAADILSRIPRKGAKTFREALQMFRILHFTLWCEGEYHNTTGRFDNYMAPYFFADLEAGRLTEDEAQELIEEFFLTFNKDSDLYPGVQQGDNGQSMMLGGIGKDGRETYSLLSEMCMTASRELKVIDPKINLRVNKNTPLSVYESATHLTKAGLGFPQYSNDDVVIEGLKKLGYAPEDAADYAVAACWEFIIPKVGMDIPNIGAVNFPDVMNETLKNDLEASEDYESFYTCFVKRLNKTCASIAESVKNLYMIPAPFMSLMMAGRIEAGKDISEGSKYNNYGFHGVGISTAVDSLSVVKQYIFGDGSLSKTEALRIIEGKSDNAEMFARLRYEAPKFGDGDSQTDAIAVQIFKDFAKAVSVLKNEREGVVRAGTGSAMYYLWYADHVGNALSGHRQGEAFSANYAPELFVKNKGPLSVIRSLTAPDFTEVVNGGPLTMEFHSTVFREDDGITKVASLVQQFIKHGGHQLQLNAVNKETLLDAQAHPEEYKNLIVRIWGWSAYFVELDKEYQDHVISRQEYTV